MRFLVFVTRSLNYYPRTLVVVGRMNLLLDVLVTALNFIRCWCTPFRLESYYVFWFVMKKSSTDLCQYTNPFSSSKLSFLLTLLFFSRSGHCADAKWRRFQDDDRNNIDQWSSPKYTKTEIDVSTQSQSEVPLDEFAYLHCKIHNRGNYQVTWIRRMDHKVLTVDVDRFTDDQRFQLSHRKENENMEDFLLIIKYSQTNDSGIYECQVSTDPPLRFLINLKIIEFPQRNMADAPMPESGRRTGIGQENEANIEGTNIVEHGGEINLRCTVIIRSPIDNSPIVQWYLNNTIISFGPGQPFVQRTNDSQLNHIVDELTVLYANQSYAGTYTCIAENSSPKSITVTVNCSKTNSSTKKHPALLLAALFTFIHGHLIRFSLVPH